jgi:hypothetical protein
VVLDNRLLVAPEKILPEQASLVFLDTGPVGLAARYRPRSRRESRQDEARFRCHGLAFAFRDTLVAIDGTGGQSFDLSCAATEREKR